jgi:hypothetical protein
LVQSRLSKERLSTTTSKNSLPTIFVQTLDAPVIRDSKPWPERRPSLPRPTSNVCWIIPVHLPAMPKDATPTDADVVFNRANIALAHSQRLVQSWLPTKTGHDAQPQKTQQELLKEDEELFKPTPEL